MKTMLRNLLLVLAIVGWASAAPAAVLFTETFSYPNGNLATAPPEGGVSGGLWTRTSNSTIVSPNVAVSDGKISLYQKRLQPQPFNPTGEDVRRGFSAPTPGATIYAALDVSTSGSNARAMFAYLGVALFITPPVSGGDFTFGIAQGPFFVPTSWPGGLSFNTTYRTVWSYEPNTGIAKLWVNPVDQSSTSVSYTSAASGGVSALALFQEFTQGSFLNYPPPSVQVIDNIVVGTSFNDVLAVPASAFGDYNNDGTVDAADYIVWRKTGGTQAEYDTWRANFGETLGGGAGANGGGPSGSSANPAVPEPATLLMLIVAAGCGLLRRPAPVVRPLETRGRRAGTIEYGAGRNQPGGHRVG